LETLAEAELMTGRPFIFSNDADTARFQETVATALGIPPETSDICIVGSARTGFSLDPDRFGAPFRQTSDIDVAVVHSGLFDEVWRTMLAWDYLTMRNRAQPEQRWLYDRHHEVWSGWCNPTAWNFRERGGITLSIPTALKLWMIRVACFVILQRLLGVIGTSITRSQGGKLHQDVVDHRLSLVGQEESKVLPDHFDAQSVHGANDRVAVVLELRQLARDVLAQLLRDHTIERDDEHLAARYAQPVAMQDAMDAANQSERLASPRTGLDADRARVQVDQRQHLLPSNPVVPRHWE
jgi:hypothetical protein